MKSVLTASDLLVLSPMLTECHCLPCSWWWLLHRGSLAILYTDAPEGSTRHRTVCLHASSFFSLPSTGGIGIGISPAPAPTPGVAPAGFAPAAAGTAGVGTVAR